MAVKEGEVVVGESLAKELSLIVGSRVTVGGTGMTVSAITHDEWYSHTGVVWTSRATWQKLAHIPAAESIGTVLAVSYDAGASVDINAANAAAARSAQPPAAPSRLSARTRVKTGP
ncbi:hypothetical protein [Amycolatopsis plumensis]|uniref:hypothetical protein n=1 Tax=Amycolatopsis plumensis TaxID=236508 RepID=UPI00361CCE36